MSGLLTYTLSLQDRMSSSLKAIGISSDGALTRFAALEKKVNGAKTTMRDMGSTIGSLREKVEALKAEREWIPESNLRSLKAYNREIDTLERKIDKLSGTVRKSGGGGRGGMLKNFIGGTLIAGGIAAASAGLVAGIGTSLNAGMDASKNKTSFEVMSGVEAGGKLFNDLNKFAQDSIFGMELLDNAKMMRAFGIETEKVMPSLKMLGDISMGDKEKLGSLSLAYSQIMSTGRLMGQDLLQLVNAGFNPLRIISEKTGISIGELKGKMEEGAISAQMVEAAFQSATGPGGQFYNMTQKIAETPFGKWEAFKGQLQGVAMQIGTSLMPVFGKVMDVLGRLADQLPAVIDSFSPLFDTLTNFPIEQIIASVAGLVAPLLKNLLPAFQTIIAGAGMVWDNLSPIFQSLQPIIAMVGVTVSDLLPPIFSLVSVLLKFLSPALSFLVTLLTYPVGLALKLVVWLVEKLGAALEWVLTPLKWIGQGFDWLGDKLRGFFGSSNDVVDKAMDTGVAAATNVQHGFASAYNNGQAFNTVAADITNPAMYSVADKSGSLTAQSWQGGFTGAYNPSVIHNTLSTGINDPSLNEMYKSAGQNHAQAYLSSFSALSILNNLQPKVTVTTQPTEPWSFSRGGVYTGNLPGIEKKNNVNLFADLMKGVSDGNKKGGRGRSKSNAADKSREAIATGGTKNTTIHITIGKQIETLTVNAAGGIKESAKQIGDIVLDEMTRVLAMSQSLA